MKNLKYFIIAVFTMLPFYAVSQTEVIENPAELEVEDFLEITLPPLGVLMENARQSPNVKYQEEYVSQQERELKSVKRTWLRYIKLNAGYQYGQVAYLGNPNDLDDASNSINNNTGAIFYSDRARSYYNLGATLSLPLDEIFDKRNRIKKQESVMRGAQYEADRNFNQLALQIVDAYTVAMENLAILRTRAEAYELASAQYKLSERDFLNGRLDAQGLSRQKNIESVNIREFEVAKSTLLNAILRLEILSGTRIISK